MPDHPGADAAIQHECSTCHMPMAHARTVDAELWYQPISYRRARALGRHRAAEIDRFLRYYDAMAARSAVVLTRDRATTD